MDPFELANENSAILNGLDEEVESPKKTWAQMTPEEREASIAAFQKGQEELSSLQADVETAGRWEAGMQAGGGAFLSNLGRLPAGIPIVGLPLAAYVSAQGERVGEAGGSALAELTGLGVVKDKDGNVIYAPDTFEEAFKKGGHDKSLLIPGYDKLAFATGGELLSRALSPVKGVTKGEYRDFVRTVKGSEAPPVESISGVNKTLEQLDDLSADPQASMRAILGIADDNATDAKNAAKFKIPTREGRFVPEGDEMIGDFASQGDEVVGDVSGGAALPAPERVLLGEAAGEAGESAASSGVKFKASAPFPKATSDQVIGDRIMEIISQPRYRATSTIDEAAKVVKEDIDNVRAFRGQLLGAIDEASQGVPFGELGVPVSKDSKLFLSRLFSEEFDGVFDMNIPGVQGLIKIARGSRALTATEVGEAVNAINALRKQTGAFARSAGTVGKDLGTAKNAINEGLQGIQSELINRIDQVAMTHQMPVTFGQVQDTLTALNTLSESLVRSTARSQGRTAEAMTRNITGALDDRSLFKKAKDAFMGRASPSAGPLANEGKIRKGALDMLLSSEEASISPLWTGSRPAAQFGMSLSPDGSMVETPDGTIESHGEMAAPQSQDPFYPVNIPDQEDPMASDITGAGAVESQEEIPEEKPFVESEPQEEPVIKEKFPSSVNGFLDKGADISNMGFDPKTSEQVKILLTGDPSQQREGLYRLKKERPELFEATKIPGYESIIDGHVVDPDEKKKMEIAAGQQFKLDLKKKLQVVGALRRDEPIPSWSYKHFGGEEQMDFIDTFLEGQEGGLRTDGYWGGNDKSGVTIGAGVDLGQWSLSDLQKTGVSSQILQQVYPYIGAKGKRVESGLARAPLKLSEEDARELTQKVKQAIKDEVGEKFRQASGVPIDELPIQAQAVIYSLGYNYGAKLDTKQPKLFAALTEGNWGLAAKLLTKIKSNPELRQRRAKEASILSEIAVQSEAELYAPSGDVKGVVQTASGERQEYTF